MNVCIEIASKKQITSNKGKRTSHVPLCFTFFPLKNNQKQLKKMRSTKGIQEKTSPDLVDMPNKRGCIY